jgi:hydroxymethylglutaryl-CoA reductase
LILTEKLDKLKLIIRFFMNGERNSRLPDFFKVSETDRLRVVKKFAGLTSKEIEVIKKGALTPGMRGRLSENVIGSFSLPYSIAPNFLINGRNYLVPMVTEEPSVVAAASYGAKMARRSGGITAESLGNFMYGQVYLVGLKRLKEAERKVLNKRNEIIDLANLGDPTLVKAGGGVRDIRTKIFKNKEGGFLRIHLIIDVGDAMGANTADKMAERVAPLMEKMTGGRALLKIISNLADERLVRATAVIKKETLKKKGFDETATIKNIVKASYIAESDVYRALTNNKGILNGMGAVALATGNDWRALEAACHGFAARSGGYQPLSKWRKDNKGNLRGTMTVPVTAGTVGESIRNHPQARTSLKIMGVSGAAELAQVMAAVGLVQNLAALRALVSEGIVLGHKTAE